MNDEKIIGEFEDLDKIGYEGEVECQETECEESSAHSVIRTILAKACAVFAVVGTTIILFKCKGCMTKWAVRMLEKKGFTVIQPGQNVTIVDNSLEDDEQEIDETEE